MKRKLLLAVATLLLSAFSGGGGNSLHATDYDWSSLLPNPFSNRSAWHNGNGTMTLDGVRGEVDAGTDIKCGEVYNWTKDGTTFDVYRILYVPNGTYTFRAAVMSRKENIWDSQNGTVDDDCKVVIYANSDQTRAEATTLKYKSVTTTVTDNCLRIGIKTLDGNKGNWMGFMDVSLTTTTTDISNYLYTNQADMSVLANATEDNPVALYYPFPNSFNTTPTGWTREGTTAGNNQRVAMAGYNGWENWSGAAISANAKWYKSLSLPVGKYTFTTNAFGCAQADQGSASKDDQNHNMQVFLGTNTAAVATGANGNNSAVQSSVTGYVKNGAATTTTVDFGLTVTDADVNWVGFSEPMLIYYGSVSNEAETLPGSDVTAGKWYKYTVGATGDYTVAISGAANVVYTQDPSLLGSEVSDALTAGVKSLDGGAVYLKSDAAVTITFTPNSKGYNVGSVTAQSIADGEYLKSLTTLVLTYGEAGTNDEDASFAIIGTPAPVATLKKGGETVTTGTLTANDAAKTLTATFSEVSLTINSTYSIEIPAGAFGYEGESENAAVTVNFNTPLFADGDYYLKNKDNGAYFAGGNYWGTQAITNNIGHKVNLTAQSNGKYTIDTYLYNGGKSSANHFLNGLWCDGASAEWEFIASGDYYQISNGEANLTAGSSVGATMTLAAGTGDNTKWTLLKPAAWKAEQVARLDDATKDNGVDATFYLAAPDFNRNDDIENEKWNGTPGIDGIAGNDVVSNYNGQKWNTNPFDVYQEQTGLKPGVYKLTMKGFYRNGTTDDRNAQLYANDYSVALLNIRSTKIAPVDSIKGFTTANGDYFVPNRQNEAAQTFNNGYYENTLYFAVGADGALRIGVKKDTDASGDWTVFDEFRLTYYGAGTITKTSSVNLQGYKTFYNADVNYEVDTNTTIYKAAAPAAGWVTLTEVNTDRIIPAGTPVILKTSDTEDYEITLTPTATASSNDFDGNALQVAATDGAIDGAYILAYKSGDGNGFGFWQYTGSLKAGDIYLTAPASAKARLTIILDGEANDIDEVDLDEEGDDDAPAVNVAGQTVGKDYKGIVIKAGKKYLQR